MSLLSLKDCTVRFGGLVALSHLDLEVGENSLVGLIGPNGAGKTTVFNAITGVYRPTGGQIFFDGKNIVGLRPYQVAHLGISRTFQNIRLFSSLTVFETIQVPFVLRLGYGLPQALMHMGEFHRREQHVCRHIMKLLEFFDLMPVKDEKAASLPYGFQRRVEIVRALATRPRLLLLDEPAAGMNPTEKAELMQLIRTAKDEFGCAILIIEHDMRVVMGICERIAVLDYGVKIAEGAPSEIQNDPRVIEAYLGEKA